MQKRKPGWRSVLSISVLLVAVLVPGAVAAATPSYSVVPIDYVPYLLNNNNQGVALSGPGPGGPYFRDGINGSWTLITGGGVRGLNNFGVAAGSATSPAGGAVWMNPGINGPTLVTSSSYPCCNEVFAINDAGHMITGNIYGSYYFLAANGSNAIPITSIDYRGYKMNNHDTVAGRMGVYDPATGFWSQGLGLWDPFGGARQITTSVVPDTGYALHINDSNQVAGITGANHVTFFWDGNQVHTGFGCGDSNVLGLNNSGYVVGYGLCAYLYANGVTYDLSTLVPAGWSITFATAINDNGVIAGVGHGPNYSGGVLLIPASYSFTPQTASAGWAGGSGSTGLVSNAPDVSWTAASSQSWLSIQSGGSGMGSGAISYSVAPNLSTQPRSATLTVGNATFTVNQAGSPPPSMTASIVGKAPGSATDERLWTIRLSDSSAVPAVNARITGITATLTGGAGPVAVNSAMTLPIAVGTISPGGSANATVSLIFPATNPASRIQLTVQYAADGFTGQTVFNNQFR